MKPFTGLFAFFFQLKFFQFQKNKVPRVSAKPNLLPAELNGWHGKPPNKTSKSGISLLTSIFF